MTEIAFHFNAPDKVAYACRLLRKAVASKARVVVTGDSATLGQLDVALWTFGALEFLPHCRSAANASVKAQSPVYLTESSRETPHQQVLVNLGGEVPAGFERYERLIEVVTLDDDDRGQARSRWKHYTDRGYPIVRHDLNLKPPT
ncbi:DNA polymerase III subunit chi [Variovorax sp. VNK109]|jgi:DNA polymerase-3 subunit chi|uniref:DNA polymerase III subunit chi n=1 Tax=Variovorax sp. VNK109 TaxID=3400919 RepID=UPI003C0E63E7